MIGRELMNGVAGGRRVMYISMGYGGQIDGFQRRHELENGIHPAKRGA